MSFDGIFFLLVIAAVVYWLTRMSGGQWRSRLTLPNGRSYEYTMGDDLRLYVATGRFQGIEVMLPKEMPHIYLDSLRGGGWRVRFVFEPSQQLNLEGNFSKYYKVFAPKKYQVVALSILSPDVMATLIDHAAAFDVEIYGDRVRVISHKPVARNKRLQAALLEVATKVTQEVDHRLQSWTDANSREAQKQELHFYAGSGIRIFGRYVPNWLLGWALYVPVAVIGLTVAGFTIFSDTPFSRPVAFVTIGIFLAWLVLLVVSHYRRWNSQSIRSRQR